MKAKTNKKKARPIGLKIDDEILVALKEKAEDGRTQTWHLNHILRKALIVKQHKPLNTK